MNIQLVQMSHPVNQSHNRETDRMIAGIGDNPDQPGLLLRNERIQRERIRIGEKRKLRVAKETAGCTLDLLQLRQLFNAGRADVIVVGHPIEILLSLHSHDHQRLIVLRRHAGEERADIAEYGVE